MRSFFLFFAIAAILLPLSGKALADGSVLPLVLHEMPKPNYGVPVPETVTGKVTVTHGDGTLSGMAKVSVTDGYSVVKTDSAGNYRLTPNADAVFVYITRPSGYDVTGLWYKPLAAEADFTLEVAAEDENEFIFVHVTDTHTSGQLRSQEGLSEFVRELNALRPQPRFVVNSGDLTSLHKALVTSPEVGQRDLNSYVGIMNNLDMPHYNVAGDHTDSSYRMADFPRGDYRCGKPLYWEHLGPNFYSFEYGKIHFMSIDSSYHLGKRPIKDLEYPTLEIQPMHTAWMGEDMSARSDGTHIITSSETDLAKECPGFLDMAAEHDVRFQLTGDIHVVSEKKHEVPYRTGGALAGCWWNAKCNQLCPDLNPQGYLIYRVVGDKMEHFYKGLGQRVAMNAPRLGAPWQGTVTIEAHVTQPQDGEILEWSLDGENWEEMSEVSRPFYRTLYETDIDTTTLPDGQTTLHLRSSVTGETRTREFVVANSRESLGLETDAVLAFSTAAYSQRPVAAPKGNVEVLFNDTVVGQVTPDTAKDYSFPISAESLRKANIVRFQFEVGSDGMYISSPVLTHQQQPLFDIRDHAVNAIKRAHWGDDAVRWGGFVVGEGNLLETPFIRKQDSFCFVVETAN